MRTLEEAVDHRDRLEDDLKALEGGLKVIKNYGWDSPLPMLVLIKELKDKIKLSDRIVKELI